MRPEEYRTPDVRDGIHTEMRRSIARSDLEATRVGRGWATWKAVLALLFFLAILVGTTVYLSTASR